MRKIGCRNADACVADAEGDLIVRPARERNFDVATARRVLDAVGDEVQEQLAEAILVSENDRIFTDWQLDR